MMIYKRLLLYFGLFLFPAMGFSEEKGIIDCWYKITGARKGDIRYSLYSGEYENEKCSKLLRECEYEVKFLIVKIKVKSKEDVYISKDKGLLYFEKEEKESFKFFVNFLIITKVTGKRKGDKILIETTTIYTRRNDYKEKEVKKSEIDIAGIDCLGYELELPVMRQILTLDIGNKEKFKVFDIENLSVAEGELEVKNKEKVNIFDKEWDSYIVCGKFDKYKVTAWFSADGKIMLKKKDKDEKMNLYKCNHNIRF